MGRSEKNTGRKGAEEDRKRKCLRLRSLLCETLVFTAGLPVGFHQRFMYNSEQCAEIKPLIKAAVSELSSSQHITFYSSNYF